MHTESPRTTSNGGPEENGSVTQFPCFFYDIKGLVGPFVAYTLT